MDLLLKVTVDISANLLKLFSIVDVTAGMKVRTSMPILQ